MRTLIQSEITWVPPAPPTDRRRFRGFDGGRFAVIAASLTEATLRSLAGRTGMRSPVSTRTTSPPLELGRRHRLPLGHPKRRQPLWRRSRFLALRKLAAAPWPAAFGDRFGRVGEKHRNQRPEIDLEGKAQSPERGEVAMKSTVVRQATTSDVKHHGIAHQTKGSSCAGRPGGRDRGFRIAQRGDALSAAAAVKG